MKEPIYRAFKAAKVEESLAYEAADSIPDDVMSRDELLEVVNRFEVKFDETKAAIAENRVAIAEATAKNKAAIAEAAAKNEAAIAAAKVEMIRWVLASNAMFATVIIAVLKLL